MSAVPSVSYSITVRLELPAAGGAVSRLTAAVEQAGGVVSALDVTASGPKIVRIDVTMAARSSDHAVELVDALRGLKKDQFDGPNAVMHALSEDDALGGSTKD